MKKSEKVYRKRKWRTANKGGIQVSGVRTSLSFKPKRRTSSIRVRRVSLESPSSTSSSRSGRLSSDCDSLGAPSLNSRDTFRLCTNPSERFIVFRFIITAEGKHYRTYVQVLYYGFSKVCWNCFPNVDVQQIDMKHGRYSCQNYRPRTEGHAFDQRKLILTFFPFRIYVYTTSINISV